MKREEIIELIKKIEKISNELLQTKEDVKMKNQSIDYIRILQN